MRLAILLLAFACSRAPAPRDTLLAYQRALDQDDPQAAYALLSKDVQERVSKAEFGERWKQSAVERRADRATLLQIPFSQEAVAQRDKRISLSESGSGWKVTRGGLLEQQQLETPEALIQALVYALEQKDFPTFSHLLTKAKRAQLERLIKDQAASLRVLLAQPTPIEVESSRIVVQFHPEHRLWLLREDGEWRIDDLE